MSSFLPETLAAAGRLEKDNLDEKVAQIQKEIAQLNDGLKNFLNDNYVEFTSKFTRDQDLMIETKKLLHKTNVLQKTIEHQIKDEVVKSTKELQNLSNALKHSICSLQLSTELLSLQECIKSIKDYQEKMKHVDAALHLVHMESMLNKPESDLSNTDIYKAIEEEYLNLQSSFLSTTTSLLHSRISWDGMKNEDKSVSLSIKNETKDMKDLILALYHANKLLVLLHDFSITLLEKIIKPIIEHNCEVHVKHENVFTLDILSKQKIPHYKSVLYNLQLLFKFLHQHLNVAIPDGQSFLRMLQPYLWNPLTDTLTTNCISRTIPTSNADLKNFDPVIEAMEQFQSLLVEIGFITTDELFLSDYTKKVDELFFNRYMSETLEKARCIMKEPLHVSVMYEPKDTVNILDGGSVSVETDDVILNWTLSSAAFELPKCQISCSAKEILALVRNILDEACHFSDTFAATLFYMCRTIFEMYAGLMPEYHWKFLETIPQHVALFHNSCMYLAHHLLTLGYEYRGKLPKSTATLNLIFTDQVRTLRNTATENMLKHMRYQRDIIIDILKESGLSTLGQSATLNPSTECELRQCIRQLELLKTVWVDVLPVKMYCKAIGCIANSMIEELITRVISVEDIPAAVATELVIVFSIVISRVPRIFPDEKQIRQHVRMWEKFLQLVRVLEASMNEIKLSWGNGEGQLARVFTASEMKHLIRALFQNTERRSELLASIKEY